MSIMKGPKSGEQNEISLTPEELRGYFEMIGNNGDSIIYKKDGLRPRKRYTVSINSGTQSFEAIRCDDDSLSEAMKRAFQEYKLAKT